MPHSFVWKLTRATENLCGGLLVVNVQKRRKKKMAETKAEASQSTLENALSDLVRRAVRAEIQEIARFMHQQDRLLQ